MRRSALPLRWAASFNTKLTDFTDKLAVSSDPSTRTRENIADTLASKKLFVAEAREIARVINAYPPITNAQRLSLGLTPRKGEAAPINPPTEAPVLEVAAANGRTLRVKLRSLDSNRRGKPDDVAGATVFSFVGNAPPADMSLWKFEGSTTKTSFEVEFPPTVPAGSQVFLTAFWFSPRSQSGPACVPISAYIAGGVAASMAA